MALKTNSVATSCHGLLVSELSTIEKCTVKMEEQTLTLTSFLFPFYKQSRYGDRNHLTADVAPDQRAKAPVAHHLLLCPVGRQPRCLVQGSGAAPGTCGGTVTIFRERWEVPQGAREIDV